MSMIDFLTGRKTRRPRIYAIYSDRGGLREYGGDMISELETLRWMSLSADVFYNNVRFDPSTGVAGDENLAILGTVGDYDLAYVRDNIEVLSQCRARGIPTVFFGHVRAEALQHADYVAVHTRGEAAHYTLLASRLGFPIKTLLMEQPGRSDFIPRQGEVLTESLRRRWGGGFNLGFFGRIDRAAMPDTLMSIRDMIRFNIRDVSIVFAGKLRWQHRLPADVFHERRYFTGEEMPYALSACTAAIGIEQPEAEWAGSNRTLDSIRCGVPIITRPYGARVEQLGADYPLFFSEPLELLQKLTWLRYDVVFQADLAAHMRSLPAKFSYESIQRRNADRLNALLFPPTPGETEASAPQRRRKTKT